MTSHEEEQYIEVDRWLRDAKDREGNDITPEDYYKMVEIAMYWIDRIKPTQGDLRIRMEKIIETYEQHRTKENSK